MRQKEVFEKIMTEYFPHMMKSITTYLRCSKTQNRRNKGNHANGYHSQIDGNQ